MSKVTAKLQVTLPKAIADQYGIKPGDQVEWVPAGDVIRVLPPSHQPQSHSIPERLRLFDQATERRRQPPQRQKPRRGASGRGWTREELYRHGSAH